MNLITYLSSNVPESVLSNSRIEELRWNYIDNLLLRMMTGSAEFQAETLNFLGAPLTSQRILQIADFQTDSFEDSLYLPILAAWNSNRSELPLVFQIDLARRLLDIERSRRFTTSAGFRIFSALVLAPVRFSIKDVDPNPINSHREHFAPVLQECIRRNGNSLKEEWLDDLRRRLDGLSPKEHLATWKDIPLLDQIIKYRAYLWAIAPESVQAEVVRRRFARFFEIIMAFHSSEHPHVDSLSPPCNEVYGFSELDVRLAHSWQDGETNHEAAKMLSARGAERLVRSHYAALGHEVADIAAHQVTEESGRWRDGDLLLDDTLLVDVKNARKASNSTRYPEICVPRFKQDRESDVQISAVHSPLLKYQEYNDPQNFENLQQTPVFLGSLTLTVLRKLEGICKEHGLVRLDLPRKGEIARFLPPWLFDYSDRFYASQVSILNEFHSLEESEVPLWDDIKSVLKEKQAAQLSYLQIFLASSRRLPTEWLEHFSPTMQKFLALFAKSQGQRTSRPYLYTFILVHFLDCLRDETTPSEYSPADYRKVLSTSIPQAPLKMVDPLDYIDEFISTLCTVWQNREKLSTKRFKTFTFSGSGLLLGIPEDGTAKTTILAYCGGTKGEQGACRYAPLIYGQHETCSCGKLKCPDCGFCQTNCEFNQRGPISEEKEQKTTLPETDETQPPPWGYNDLPF